MIMKMLMSSAWMHLQPDKGAERSLKASALHAENLGGHARDQ